MAEVKRYVCANNHSFDVARQGYVNLLLSTQRNSKSPGDNAEMIAARHAFLEGGFYQPLRDRIIDRLAQLQKPLDHTQQVLDLGCGEGYYTTAFNASNRQIYALDISKAALAMAAKRERAITWCVGTSRAMPFHDASLDVVTNIFCRPHLVETQRVLRENGTLLIVGAGAQHLRELREVLYENINNENDEAHPEGFALIDRETMRFSFTLQGPAIGQLARMTPHYWRATTAGRARLDALQQLTLQTDFALRVFQART